MRSTITAIAALVSFESAAAAQTPSPLVFGEAFSIDSKVMHEVRRINVFRPTVYGDSIKEPLPVMYMPDGGMAEDFLHVAGLIEVSVSNGTMRPFILVGIENTQRRRDMTGPTENPEDRKIAPQVGGSAMFREFIRTELMPAIKSRYCTTSETAIVGESLAGLFIVETLLREPNLFDTYIAFDPSLWWNNGKLVTYAPPILKERQLKGKSLYIATSSNAGLAELSAKLNNTIKSTPSTGLDWHYVTMPAESHATIYHPAALQAFRTVFKPTRSSVQHAKALKARSGYWLQAAERRASFQRRNFQAYVLSQPPRFPSPCYAARNNDSSAAFPNERAVRRCTDQHRCI